MVGRFLDYNRILKEEDIKKVFALFFADDGTVFGVKRKVKI